MSDRMWPHERRARVKAKIDKEAKRAAARLGASHVMIIAMFAEPETGHFHLLDGGTAPMPVGDLYANMVKAVAINAATGGEDTTIQ